MVRHFLLGKAKEHDKKCYQDYLIRRRVAINFTLLIFGFLAVYLFERYVMPLPLWAAVGLFILLVWYVVVAFFEIVIIHHGDQC